MRHEILVAEPYGLQIIYETCYIFSSPDIIRQNQDPKIPFPPCSQFKWINLRGVNHYCIKTQDTQARLGLREHGWSHWALSGGHAKVQGLPVAGPSAHSGVPKAPTVHLTGPFSPDGNLLYIFDTRIFPPPCLTACKTTKSHFVHTKALIRAQWLSTPGTLRGLMMVWWEWDRKWTSVFSPVNSIM